MIPQEVSHQSRLSPVITGLPPVPQTIWRLGGLPTDPHAGVGRLVFTSELLGMFPGDQGTHASKKYAGQPAQVAPGAGCVGCTGFPWVRRVRWLRVRRVCRVRRVHWVRQVRWVRRVRPVRRVRWVHRVRQVRLVRAGSTWRGIIRTVE